MELEARLPEPMGLGMSHLSEDDELFQHLATLSNQLELAIELVAITARRRTKYHIRIRIQTLLPCNSP
jgi:hypothetical protein